MRSAHHKGANKRHSELGLIWKWHAPLGDARVDIALGYIKFAILAPFGALGVCAGLLISTIFTYRRGRPTFRDWLVALLVNAPNLILVFEILKNEPNVSQLDLTAMIAVLFGIGGFGLGWVLRLIWLTVRPRKAI